jgi:uncharacterized protein YpuA (DUF1002 family)
MRFSKWVELREQSPVAPVAGAVAPGRKDDVAQTDMKIKKTIAGNLNKPDKMRKAALQNLAMQMANDPNAKPDDIKKVADAMGSNENKPGQPQK